MHIGTIRPVVDGKLQCRDCGEWVPVEQYYASKRGNGGGFSYDSYCGPCKRIRTRENRQAARDRERRSQARERPVAALR